MNDLHKSTFLIFRNNRNLFFVTVNKFWKNLFIICKTLFTFLETTATTVGNKKINNYFDKIKKAAFLGVEVEHLQIANLHRDLWLNLAKLHIHSRAKVTRVGRNLQIDPRAAP